MDLTERGFVVVDEHLRTTADHVWAAGDVAGSPQFTHASWNVFRVLRANITGGDAVITHPTVGEGLSILLDALPV